ncbi:tRNA (adenosine(37)-N6)-threonylcarbamoyltransferase complex dimerization subunit type 1 TsaB [Pseudobacteroides cellulosolvens]|uniref:Universal protein YeaZ n=1 Tax=Pseudobacteroides cellulosolvens ATCC 35603 = DSM 2933 TaxID=398512 RepID=A0A0L6JMU9_9FIRM|nr:tRNA (adenosine(37)-N6)-threonylcarbamoyltransferase complex dimerization subunit type 1 TsaB [Pseudobacteroides cellulosolvens]KNY27141.1 universal protein YeaZ [Pseudobacteroides cellulosolvens ATCC 35603 = DSM 2933]
MKVLAVDTSSTVAAVAIIDDEVLLGEYFINNRKTHSQKLMPMIKELMDSLGLTPEDIDIYAASVGPGSFTGLRIGVTSIKAMAYALEKPVISVPTLDALAYNAQDRSAVICPIMDARNNQVYTALYRFVDKGISKESEYMALPIEELMHMFVNTGNKVCFVGDGVDRHREYLHNELGEKCSFAPHNLILNKASSVAQLALTAAKAGKLENPVDMVPFYLRKSQAEQEYDRRCGDKTHE